MTLCLRLVKVTEDELEYHDDAQMGISNQSSQALCGWFVLVKQKHF